MHLGQKKTRLPYNKIFFYITSFHNTCLKNIDCERNGSKSEHDLCHSIHIISTIGYVANTQWPALQLAWLAQWIEHCTRSSQRSGSNSRSGLNFFRFFFNPLGSYSTAKIIFSFNSLMCSSKMICFIYFNSRKGHVTFTRNNIPSPLVKIKKQQNC